MLADWKQHCPIDEKDHPILRQAWGGGWMHRLLPGPGEPEREKLQDVLGSPSLLSAWLEGFSAADRQERSG